MHIPIQITCSRRKLDCELHISISVNGLVFKLNLRNVIPGFKLKSPGSLRATSLSLLFFLNNMNDALSPTVLFSPGLTAAKPPTSGADGTDYASDAIVFSVTGLAPVEDLEEESEFDHDFVTPSRERTNSIDSLMALMGTDLDSLDDLDDTDALLQALRPPLPLHLQDPLCGLLHNGNGCSSEQFQQYASGAAPLMTQFLPPPDYTYAPVSAHVDPFTSSDAGAGAGYEAYVIEESEEEEKSEDEDESAGSKRKRKRKRAYAEKKAKNPRRNSGGGRGKTVHANWVAEKTAVLDPSFSYRSATEARAAALVRLWQRRHQDKWISVLIVRALAMESGFGAGDSTVLGNMWYLKRSELGANRVNDKGKPYGQHFPYALERGSSRKGCKERHELLLSPEFFSSCQ